MIFTVPQNYIATSNGLLSGVTTDTGAGTKTYTWGTNIHFAPGQYNPHTIQGQKLLGHELWHVLQQKAGRVKNPFGGGVAVVQDHALEAEADRMGIKAALTPVVKE